MTTPWYSSGAPQRGAVMQHATERMPYPPHRLVQSIELLEQLVEQVVPVIVDRKARVVPMAVHVRDPEFRRQSVEQLAIGGRGKAIGVGEEDALRHGRHCRTD